MKSDAGLSARAAAFLLILFSSCCSESVSSNLKRPYCTVWLQADLSRAVAFQLFWSMFKALRSLLHTPLNRSCGLPMGDTHSLDAELNKRIGKAATTTTRLTKKAWNNNKLAEDTKSQIYRACVVSILPMAASPDKSES